MNEPVRLTIAQHEPQAELLCGLLRSAGIVCMHRITDMAFGSGGEMPNSGAGPREVLVRGSDLAQARELLDSHVEDGFEDPSAATDPADPGGG